LLGNDELEPEAASGIGAAADGNPLFIEEMLAMLLESGEREVRVPPTIKALLSARVDQLDPAERVVLGRGSVEGQLFHRGAVEAMAMPAVPAERQLVALVRKELVRPDRAQFAGEDAFRFRHLLIRDAAYEALPKATRATMHERFAAWLELRPVDLFELDEIVGYHLEQADRYRTELGLPHEDGVELSLRAAEKLGAAGRRAFERGDMPAAKNLLGRAAALLSSEELPRQRLVPMLAEAIMEVGDFAAAESLLDETLASVHEEELQVYADAVLTRLLVHHHVAEDLAVWRAEVLGVTKRLIPKLEQLEAHAELAKAWRMVGFVYGPVCQWQKQVATAQRGLEYARLAGDRRLESRL